MSSHGERDSQVDSLRRQLEGWKEVVVLLKSVLDWDQHFYPWVVVGVVTFKFLLWWCVDPTLFAAASLLFLTLSLADVALPILAPKLFPTDQWGPAQENNFHEFCESVVDFKNDARSFVSNIFLLKSERPRFYLVVMVTVLLLVAWVGSALGDLFSFYLIALGFALYPGAKKHGLVDAYLSGVIAKVKEILFKKSN